MENEGINIFTLNSSGPQITNVVFDLMQDCKQKMAKYTCGGKISENGCSEMILFLVKILSLRKQKKKKPTTLHFFILGLHFIRTTLFKVLILIGAMYYTFHIEFNFSENFKLHHQII